MKTRTTPLLILAVSLGFAGAGTAGAASSPAAPAGAVILRDAAGKEIGRARSVWLAPGRLGIPAGVFLKLGLSGRVRPGKAELAYPFSDGATRFQAGERRVLRLSADERRWSEEYSFPVALTQSGQLYVAAAVALKDFAGLVTGTPGPKRGTLILQRTDQLQSAVEQAEGVGSLACRRLPTIPSRLTTRPWVSRRSTGRCRQRSISSTGTRPPRAISSRG